NESDNEYDDSKVLKGKPSYSEAKYPVVNVFNFGPRTLRFVSAQMVAGIAVSIPDPGAVITSGTSKGNMARLVFKQNDWSINPRGPEVNIIFKGKKGNFNLYAQQNYAFLMAGDVNARASYSGFGNGRFTIFKMKVDLIMEMVVLNLNYLKSCKSIAIIQINIFRLFS
ncbi:7308_t:CDS:1, partial [Dentiscutata heterogama]